MRSRIAVGILGMTLCGSAATWSQPRLALDPGNGGLRLPDGFRAVIVADDLGSLRFMTVGPTGDIYVKTRAGGIIALRDTNSDGRADTRETFGGGGGTGLAIRDGWLYHSTNSAVFRYRLTPGELVPKGEPETIVSGLPDERQHNAKSFAFDDAGRLYVEVGSPSNAFGDPDRALGAKGHDPTEFLQTHGGFWSFDPNRANQRQADGLRFSTGHRHVLSVAWNPVAKAFFVVMMGRDQLNTVDPEHYSDDDNAELPAEELHLLRQGGELGWPFTYYDPLKKARMLAPEFGGDNQKRAEPGKYPDPLVAFPAHWAPLQMAFYSGTQFPEKYRGGAFIAFHGSWNRAPKPQKGYSVGFVPFDEKGMPRGGYEVFADGFAGAPVIASPGDARYRPCGLAVGPDGSVYVADSQKGRVWRIAYVGAATTPRAVGAPPGKPPVRPAPIVDQGPMLYARNCAVCHMASGSGVPDMQPALRGAPIVKGPPAPIVRILLRGPDAVLPPDRVRYSNVMLDFSRLSDTEIAAIVNYVRRNFGGAKDPPLTAAQVAAQRAQP